MGMSIEQIIKYLSSPICGDAVIGEEKQKEYDAHDSAVIILHKYQKIEQILDIEPVLTLLNNPTNGDMIKAVFPSATIEILKSDVEKTMVCVTWNFKGMPSYYNRFYEDWWNAPYKAESEDKE